MRLLFFCTPHPTKKRQRPSSSEECCFYSQAPKDTRVAKRSEKTPTQGASLWYIPPHPNPPQSAQNIPPMRLHARLPPPAPPLHTPPEPSRHCAPPTRGTGAAFHRLLRRAHHRNAFPGYGAPRRHCQAPRLPPPRRRRRGSGVVATNSGGLPPRGLFEKGQRYRRYRR